MHARLSLGRAIGLCLFVIGILLFYFIPPIAYPLGTLATWLTVWPIFITIATGCALMFGFGLKMYTKSMLAGVSALLLVTMISLTPLPLDHQLLLISLFGLVMVLLSRVYLRRKSRRHARAEAECKMHGSFPKKVAGCMLIVTGALLFYFIIPTVLSFGLFATCLVSWPILAVAVIGYSLIVPLSSRKFFEWLFSAMIITLLPWIVVLSKELQTLLGSLLTFGFILSFSWYYRRYKSDKSVKSDQEE